jgi:hypothetical protein
MPTFIDFQPWFYIGAACLGLAIWMQIKGRDSHEPAMEFSGHVIFAAVGIAGIVWFWHDVLHDFQDLETGRVASIRLWAPVVWIYRSFGMIWAMRFMTVFCVLGALGTCTGIWASFLKLIRAGRAEGPLE